MPLSNSMSVKSARLPVLQVVSYSMLGKVSIGRYKGGFSIAEPVKSCPAGWERFRGKCYFFAYVPKDSDASLKFDDARKKCTDAGADLVALNNEQVRLTIK